MRLACDYACRCLEFDCLREGARGGSMRPKQPRHESRILFPLTRIGTYSIQEASSV